MALKLNIRPEIEEEMETLCSYEDFVQGLERREYFGQKLGLERIQRLLDRLGNPERWFPSIHIAGTNGKGSTAAMIASILKEAGYRIGLYTSPHLTDFCERIRIGPDTITPDEVLGSLQQIYEVEEEALTFFELATAIAFLHFAKRGVDGAVIETGLGGRLDATNVITPVVSVITTIGIDHEAHLGGTVVEIAREKAGIIKLQVPVVVGPLADVARRVVEEVARNHSAPVVLFDRTKSSGLSIGLEGEHQRENAAIAIRTAQLLREVASFSPSDEAIRAGLEKVSWPGRLETVRLLPWVVLDGAHNPQAMQAVRRFLVEKIGGRRLTVVFGVMADKDVRGILSELRSIADELVLTAPRSPRAMETGRLAAIASDLGKKVTVVTGVGEAIESVLKRMTEDEVLLVTGSLFVVGEAKRWFDEERS